MCGGATYIYPMGRTDKVAVQKQKWTLTSPADSEPKHIDKKRSIFTHLYRLSGM